jgi:hypothetical protein|tara:strand:- start:749 stop:1666 length:918 start_codon:yes stop_codon:yes gene_type:complete
MIQLTIFDSIYDNKTHKQMDFRSFAEFESMLYKLSESKKYKTKKDAPLISPAVYTEGTTRSNTNVEYWGGFAIVDVDDYEGDMKDIEQAYADYQYVCYSTASSTVEHPKFRLVFPISQVIDHDDIKHFWYALNKEIGGIADVQTKDMSRMYYVPSSYEGAHNFIFTHEGRVMCPRVIMEKHKWVKPPESFLDKLPESIRKGLIEHKKNSLTNTSYSWTGYLDCPFINKKQVEEFKTINGSGWYHKLYTMMVTTAGNAMAKGYPITAKEIEYLMRDLDTDTGGWYAKRPISKEAERAIEFVFRNNF